MGLLSRYAIILVLSLSSAGFCLVANSQASLQNKTSKKATGSVSGRITIKGKGKAGIVVGLRTGGFGSQMGPLFKATTDVDGNYRIADLPAGNYQIAPLAPAFVVSDFNSFGLRGKGLILAEGENVEGIDFSMERGGVITGKVSQADGRPVIEERINIMSVDQPDRQGPTLQPGSMVQTDDRGIYRVFGLPAGRYKVFIGQSPDGIGGGPIRGRPTYERVFHPDVTNPNEAKIIELGEGSEATNVDIMVGQSISGFAAAGVVIDGETNKPIANLRFRLQRIVGEHRNFVNSMAQSDRLGVFRFENLIPGKYSVANMPQPNNDMRSDSVTFEVVDQDVAGLILKASRGASVSGIVVLEGIQDTTVQRKIAQLRLHAYNRNEVGGSGFVESSPINPDGGFRIGGLQPGLAQFQLSAQDNALTGFAIARVERDGVVIPSGVEIKSGEQITGLRIVLGYGSGIVRGIIIVKNGTLPPGARFGIRLVNPENPSIMTRPDNVDARGRFAVEGLPAGLYDLHVNAFIPGSRSRYPSTRQSVSVTEGSVTEVEVVIDLDADPSPKP